MRCSFYSNINCLKSVIDTLQQRCHMTLLVSLLLQTSKLLYVIFSTSNAFTILRKIAVNLQAKSFRRICENVKSLRKLYQQSTSSQVVFKLSTKIFNNFDQVIRHTYLPIHLFTEAYLYHLGHKKRKSGNTSRIVGIFTWTWNIWGDRAGNTSKQRKIVAFVRNCSVKITLRLF